MFPHVFSSCSLEICCVLKMFLNGKAQYCRWSSFRTCAATCCTQRSPPSELCVNAHTECGIAWQARLTLLKCEESLRCTAVSVVLLLTVENRNTHGAFPDTRVPHHAVGRVWPPPHYKRSRLVFVVVFHSRRVLSLEDSESWLVVAW